MLGWGVWGQTWGQVRRRGRAAADQAQVRPWATATTWAVVLITRKGSPGHTQVQGGSHSQAGPPLEGGGLQQTSLHPRDKGPSCLPQNKTPKANRFHLAGS